MNKEYCPDGTKHHLDEWGMCIYCNYTDNPNVHLQIENEELRTKVAELELQLEVFTESARAHQRMLEQYAANLRDGHDYMHMSEDGPYYVTDRVIFGPKGIILYESDPEIKAKVMYAYFSDWITLKYGFQVAP